MNNEVSVKNNANEIIPQSKVQLLKDQICRGASDSELELFIAQCNRTRLDPFLKQCWAVKRWDSDLKREVLSFQTSVDGFRVIANRSDKYSGQLGPFWCGDDGVWKDVWLKNTAPIAAKVGVLRSDFKEVMWAVAKFSSYAAKKKDGTLTSFWLKMPDLMIAKVSECLALRKAFPNDLSGIYSKEEMDQADVRDVNLDNIPEPIKVEKKSDADMKTIPDNSFKAESYFENFDRPTSLFDTNEVGAPDLIVTNKSNNIAPNEALSIYEMQGGRYAGTRLIRIDKKDLIKYVKSCELHAKEVGKELPNAVQENIWAIKKYLGME